MRLSLHLLWLSKYFTNTKRSRSNYAPREAFQKKPTYIIAPCNKEPFYRSNKIGH